MTALPHIPFPSPPPPLRPRPVVLRQSIRRSSTHTCWCLHPQCPRCCSCGARSLIVEVGPWPGCCCWDVLSYCWLGMSRASTKERGSFAPFCHSPVACCVVGVSHRGCAVTSRAPPPLSLAPTLLFFFIPPTKRMPYHVAATSLQPHCWSHSIPLVALSPIDSCPRPLCFGSPPPTAQPSGGCPRAAAHRDRLSSVTCVLLSSHFRLPPPPPLKLLCWRQQRRIVQLSVAFS